MAMSSAKAASHVPAPAASKEDIRRQFVVTPDARVVYSLAADVLCLACTHEKDADITLDPTALNNAILHSTVLWERGGNAVLKLSEVVALKTGKALDISHVSTLDHIHAHAQGLPITRTLGILVSPARTHHFITYFAGDTLEAKWKHLSATQKRMVQEQLDHVFLALRRVPPPPSPLHERTPFGGGEPPRCKDTRRFLRVADKPITDERQFNLFLTTHERYGHDAPWIRMIRSQMREDHACVMTHGDLHPGNIIVRVREHCHGSRNIEDEVELVAVIDWDRGGWYPEYWEYIKALNTIGPKCSLVDWWEYLPPAIGIWAEEYSMDRLLSRLHR